MLGHKKVTTTQIYAKIVDVKKNAAADAIPIPKKSKSHPLELCRKMTEISACHGTRTRTFPMNCSAETYTSLVGSNGCADQLTNWDGTKKLGLESVTKKKERSY